MATEHLQQGELTEALDVFEEILRGQLARYGNSHYRVGTAHHNIGIVHMRRQDYPNAIRSYREAVRVRKQTLDPDHPDVAVSLAQLGVAYLESKKHRKAIGAFREALKIRRKCHGNTHPRVAKILNNIGCALYELNELEVAQVAFEEALSIQRELLRDLPVDSEDNSEGSLLAIASTQCNIASIKLYCGEFDDAAVDLEEAMLIQQCVLGDDHPVVLRTVQSLQWLETARSGNAVGDDHGEGIGAPPAPSSSLPTTLVPAKNFLPASTFAAGGDRLVSGAFGPPPQQQQRVASALSVNSLSTRSQQHSQGKNNDLTVLDALERNFMTFHANLDRACGVEGSDDEQRRAALSRSDDRSASSSLPSF